MMAKKKPSFLKRLSLWLISFILLLGVGGYAVSSNPRWITPLIEKVLQSQGIKASLSHVSGKWQGYHYHFDGMLSVDAPGALIEQANVQTTLDMGALWNRQPFIEVLKISEVAANINVDEWQLNENNKKSTVLDYQQFLPQQWSLNCPHCRISLKSQTFDGSLSGNGQGNKAASLFLSDKQLGVLALQYEGKQQILTVQSDYLNINKVTDYHVELKQINAMFYLQDVWRSQLEADINYQGSHSEVRLQGEGENRLRLDATTQGKTLTIFAERQREKIYVKTDHMDMGWLNHIKPAVLPFLSNHLSTVIHQPLQAMEVGGEVSGSMILYRNGNNQLVPESINAKLTQFTVKTDSQVIDRVSGQLSYHNDILNYQLNLNNSTVKITDFLPKSLPVISGEVSGTWDINDQVQLPSHIKLSSEAFESLSMTHDGEELILTTEQLSINLIEKFKPVVLSTLSTQLTPRISEFLKSLSIDGTISAQVKLDAENYQLEKAVVSWHQVDMKTEHRQITALSGDAHYIDDTLDFQLNLDNSIVKLPTIFTEQLPKTTGVVKGQFTVATKQLTLEKVTLKNQDVDTVNLQGMVVLSEQIVVDLTGGLSNVNLNRLPLYLTKHFPPMTHAFLSKALVSGKKNKATIVLKGNLKTFLKKGFVLKLDAEVNEGVFHYLSNNPDIEVKKAQLNIEGKKLTVTVDSANLLTKIKKKTIRAPLKGTAVIQNMNAAEIEAKAVIKSQAMPRLAAIAERSIAQKTVKKVKKIADIKGKFDVELDLWLDVHSKPIKERFEVRLKSQNATAMLKNYPEFVIKRAKASAVINNKGLQKIVIKGKNNQQPINIVIAPFKQKKHSNIQVQVGIKQADCLKTLSQLNILSRNQAKVLEDNQIVTGKMDATVNIRLKEDGSLVNVGVKGNLSNTHFDVFGLVAHQPLAMDALVVDYQAESKRFLATIDDQLRVEVGLDKQGQLTGFLLDNLNSGSAYYSGKGIINWYAQRFDFLRFKHFYDAWSVSTRDEEMPQLDYQSNITIDNVKINPNALEPIQIKGGLENLRIASPLISGQINYRNHYIQATLERIEVDSLFNLFKTQQRNPEGREVTRIDLARDLPALDITAEQLIFKGNNVGSATIHTSIQQDHYSIDQFLLNGRGYYFDASGYEAQESQGLTTHIFADLKAENVRDVAQRFGLNDVLDAKFFDVSLSLSWPGKASTLNLRQSYGKASLNAQNVRMVNMSPGVGSLLGMMDIVGILKRVSMDFENLNGSQLSFDTVKGNWNIGGGRAMTRSAYATGSLIELQLTGGADLHRRVFDNMNLKVIPKASNIFPVIGAVAGGVVGGAAGLLVQQALGDSINQVVGLPYVISGAWDTPVVSFVGAGS